MRSALVNNKNPHLRLIIGNFLRSRRLSQILLIIDVQVVHIVENIKMIVQIVNAFLTGRLRLHASLVAVEVDVAVRIIPFAVRVSILIDFMRVLNVSIHSAFIFINRVDEIDFLDNRFSFVNRSDRVAVISTLQFRRERPVNATKVLLLVTEVNNIIIFLIRNEVNALPDNQRRLEGLLIATIITFSIEGEFVSAAKTLGGRREGSVVELGAEKVFVRGISHTAVEFYIIPFQFTQFCINFSSFERPFDSV